MTLAERIADALMTDGSGQKATRMQMMQDIPGRNEERNMGGRNKASGQKATRMQMMQDIPGRNEERNMGGRNKASVIKTIQEVLDAEPRSHKPHVNIGVIGGKTRLSPLMTGLLGCVAPPLLGKDASYYLEAIRENLAVEDNTTTTKLMMEIVAKQPVPSFPKWMINGHVLLTPNTCTYKHSDDTACVVCDAGLAVCAKCGEAESGLDRPCRALVGAFDNTRAAREGWAIFNQEKIQRDDENSIFRSDEEAVDFVRGMAARGSNYHKLALALTSTASPAVDEDA